MSVSAKSSPYETDPDRTKISSSNEYTNRKESLSTLELQNLYTKLGVTLSNQINYPNEHELTAQLGPNKIVWA